MTSRPTLLFLAPIVPAAEGNGLAMRSGVFLEAYAQRFDVTLVVLPFVGGIWEGPLPALVRQHAQRCEILPLDDILRPLLQLLARYRDPDSRRAALRDDPRPRQGLYDASAAARSIQDRLGGQSFSLLHVARLIMAPLAEAYLGQSRAILDIDEDEIGVRRRLAGLRETQGDTAGGAAEAGDARKFGALEAAWLPRFDLSLTATEAEAAALSARNPQARLAVVANAIRLPAAPGNAGLGRAKATVDLLMVGNLAFYPNADAAQFLCRNIRPHLLRAGWVPRIAIVGRAPSASIRDLAELAGVAVHADVGDVTPFYASAAVAVVPLRAGGGSRIKLLEAFAFGVPVVATSIGAEGLDVIPERHLLIADSAGDFAAAVRRLLDDPALARRLAAGASRLVEEKYQFDAVAAEIEALAERVICAPG